MRRFASIFTVLLILLFASSVSAGPLIFNTSGSSITSSVTDGDLTHSPDGNSVFDSLALKAPLTNAALVTPNLGTPSAGTLTNCTGLPTSGVTGIQGQWTQTTGSFTATPASTSTLTMTSDLTAYIKVGMGLKYAIGGTTYYGQVSAIAANLLTVRGAPLGGDVTALYYGGGTLRQMVVIIPGLYEDASSTGLIVADLKSQLIWELPVSYLVFFKVYSDVHDSGGTHGQASVRINATEVNTTAGGELIAADKTWYPTVVNIATAAYDINPGEVLDVTSVKGTTGDASDLTVIMTFLTP